MTTSAAILAQLQRAMNFHNQGQLDAAAAEYRDILQRQPRHFDSLHLLGVVHMQKGDVAEAERLIGRAVKLEPKQAPALSNYGVVLRSLNRLDEALQIFNRAVAAQPGAAETQFNRALVLMDLGRNDEALAGLERALAAQPGHAEAMRSRGVVLERLGRHEEALAASDALRATPTNRPEVLHNRGHALQGLGRFAEARADYRSALQLRPDFAEAHVALAESLLLTGEMAEGWQHYEWRWKTQGLAPLARNFAVPQWRGEAIAGKTILLHAEQGFGDTLQFCRFATLVAARGARVILEVQPGLVPLLRTLAGPSEVLARGETLPGFDLHCPLMSLPLALGGDVAAAVAPPYLAADPARVAAWAARLGTGLRCGIAWSGRASHQNDHNRSLALAALLPVLAVPGVSFVSVQNQVRPVDRAVASQVSALQTFGGELDEFSENAALIAAVDLVITVDTMAAHLAGALGKPVWVLLPFMPDWRWLQGGSETPWYPAARLFRQPAPGVWTKVIADVAEALARKAGEGS